MIGFKTVPCCIIYKYTHKYNLLGSYHLKLDDGGQVTLLEAASPLSIAGYKMLHGLCLWRSHQFH